MGKKAPKAVREGRDLIDYFYGFCRKGDADRYVQAEQFRQDVYRFIVALILGLVVVVCLGRVQVASFQIAPE